MNSSSAFSNVLSVSPVASTSQSATARSLNDDGDSPGFKKALADVSAEQDVQPKESCANKLSPDRPAKTKTASEDAAAANDKTIISSPKKSGMSEAKAEQEEIAPLADETKKVETPDPLLTIDMLAVTAPVDASEAVALANLSSAADGVVPSTPEEAGVVSLPVDADIALVNPEVAQGSVQPVVPAIAEISEDSAIKVADPILAVAVNPAAVAAPQETIAAVAAMPETIAAAGLALVKGVEVKLDKLTTDASAVVADDTLLANDDQLVSTDPKAVFEKMLQAIATSGANGSASGDPQKAPDLAAAIAALTSPAASDSSAATPGLESLSRSAEVQLPAARSFVVQTAVPVNIGQPTWSQAVGEKVLWLAAQNVQSAEIILDPPEVGPMQVKVSVHQEQTSISFTSHNAGVRELLDQSLGRLRDMFNEQGLNLVNVDVSDKSFQRQQGDGSDQQGQAARGEQEEEEALQAVSTIVHQRLVDHYA